MTYPFTRADEQPPRTPGPTPGVRVSLAGKHYWFPGSTPDQAMVLARAALPTTTLDHPLVEIEFGTRDGAVFIWERTIKGPPPTTGV